MGGMEQASYHLTTNLLRLLPGQLIANRKGKRNLPIFLPYALFKAVQNIVVPRLIGELQIIKREHIDLVHLGDGLLAPLGAALKAVTGVRVVCTTHGLDVIYNKSGYQHLIPPWLRKLDYIIPVSSATRQACLERGVDPQRCMVIPNGIDSDRFPVAPNSNYRKELEQVLGVSLAGKRVLLSVGHLVKRKGFAWFTEAVMPRLGENNIYVVIGKHKDTTDELHRNIARLNLELRVFLLGEVKEAVLNAAYHGADMMIMPNIPVPGDMEGFGIAGIEASGCGLPVLAANLEGVKDAVHEGKNGFLVPPLDAEGFINAIENFKPDPEFRARVRQFTLDNFTWDKIARDYVKVFNNVLQT